VLFGLTCEGKPRGREVNCHDVGAHGGWHSKGAAPWANGADQLCRLTECGHKGCEGIELRLEQRGKSEHLSRLATEGVW
jgi:hypothetical protein